VLARWPIRYKLIFGVTLLGLIVGLLSFSGFSGVYAYRGLVRAISLRASELPNTMALVQGASELRSCWRQLRAAREGGTASTVRQFDPTVQEHAFRVQLMALRGVLEQYKRKLAEEPNGVSARIGNREFERRTVGRIEATLARIEDSIAQRDWVWADASDDQVGADLDQLHKLASSLPAELSTRMQNLREEVRGAYRTWIVLAWSSTAFTMALLVVLVFFFYRWVFRPLNVIIEGSRHVAEQNFHHRIEIDSHDEMAELAGAMNDMTAQFLEMLNDLERQVDERTREAIQSEKLASVGFLAAGVAHEINNPLASIAGCAEAIESRLEELTETDPDFAEWEERPVVANYLRTVQEEAFRCKGITDRLLDFSRMGTSERVVVDLAELTADVIEMVRHLDRFRHKRLEFHGQPGVLVRVDPQEIKQVVLNLVTNALTSIDVDGRVDVTVARNGNQAQLKVADNGCGISSEALPKIFEPFYTHRRDGKGTGLGLSITYRIVERHGGSLRAFSDGPGRGALFVVQLDIETARMPNERQIKKSKQAA